MELYLCFAMCVEETVGHSPVKQSAGHEVRLRTGGSHTACDGIEVTSPVTTDDQSHAFRCL